MGHCATSMALFWFYGAYGYLGIGVSWNIFRMWIEYLKLY